MRLALLLGLAAIALVLLMVLWLGAFRLQGDLEAERTNLQAALRSIDNAQEPRSTEVQALQVDIRTLQASNLQLRRDIADLALRHETSLYGQYRLLAMQETDRLDDLARATTPAAWRRTFQVALALQSQLEQGLLHAEWNQALEQGRPSYAHLCRALDAYRYAAPDGPEPAQERQDRAQVGRREVAEARRRLQGTQGETDGFRPEDAW
ncbi:MAG TPA: hypothetical protein VGO93_22600 [Candidatus Xenobia bacterium]